MNKKLLGLSILILMFSIFSANAQDTEPPHWTYEGEEGAEHWGELSPDYVACLDGTAQSPIDVTGAAGLDLSNIEFGFSATTMNIFNNGHTIQVNADAGSSIIYNEINYDLLQFHFHHPSEHSVNGELADMEIHFVHRDPDGGGLAVVGVLLMAGEADNAAYAPIFDNLPAEKNEPTEGTIELDLNAMMPEARTFFTYQGSLTTPPCSEVVRWLLLDTPVELSEAQLEAFGAIFEMNARTPQPRNDRDLLHDTNG
jgi:carbonic anhydrase